MRGDRSRAPSPQHSPEASPKAVEGSSFERRSISPKVPTDTFPSSPFLSPLTSQPSTNPSSHLSSVTVSKNTSKTQLVSPGVSRSGSPPILLPKPLPSIPRVPRVTRQVMGTSSSDIEQLRQRQASGQLNVQLSAQPSPSRTVCRAVCLDLFSLSLRQQFHFCTLMAILMV